MKRWVRAIAILMSSCALPLQLAVAAPPIAPASEARSEAMSGAGPSAATPARGVSPIEATPTSEQRAAAQALFDQGRQLMDQGRAREACSRFEQSDRLEPGLGTRFHWATCHEALGKLASAHALYLAVASEAAARDQPDRERVARDRARAIEPQLARLTIDVPFVRAPALRIERDGVLIDTEEWGFPMPVDPGTHHVDASAPGWERWATDIDVPAGGGVTRVDVPPLTEQRQAFFAPLSHKIGLAALGVGAGTLALGSVFVAQAISKKNASDRAGCSGRNCPNTAGLSLRKDALRAGDRATWAMGVGLVGIGAAAALFWIWPEAESDGDSNDVRLAPVADLRGASLRLNGHF